VFVDRPALEVAEAIYQPRLDRGDVSGGADAGPGFRRWDCWVNPSAAYEVLPRAVNRQRFEWNFAVDRAPVSSGLHSLALEQAERIVAVRGNIAEHPDDLPRREPKGPRAPSTDARPKLLLEPSLRHQRDATPTESCRLRQRREPLRAPGRDRARGLGRGVVGGGRSAGTTPPRGPLRDGQLDECFHVEKL
jgi:hypothetical protein